MEISLTPQERDNPSLLTSPKGNISNSSSISSNGVHPQPPLTPKPISRSETNSYPTTFIEADSNSFKQVVQMLTGSSETTNKKTSKFDPSSKSVIPPIKTGPKKQGFKLYERRSSLKNIKISLLMPELVQNSGFSPRKPEILIPSIPSLVLSPVTPRTNDSILYNSSEEERAIAKKGYFLHPSQISTPRETEPRLLPLFPVTSPRVSSNCSS